jgi:lipopolysaccharide export system protein LptA
MSGRPFSRIVIIAALICAFIPSVSFAEADKSILKGPIVITSSTLSADANSNIAVFEGSVVAQTDDITLQSDKMTVYYTSDGDVEKINAEGNIKLTKSGRVLTSKKAVYLAKEAKITFTGEPMAVEGPNIITGSKIIYLIDQDRSIVHDSKVYIEQDGGP